ncbi:EAL domain-containing protein [Aquisalimonas sp. APHAB1-3]|uniref:bifunctional diguanylate cyclase/phosphodiesterase n=1 Tax=Aquisalimonas sp. APHAB1-3 TaxID=3402080 RepID=UPI003AAC0E6A
MTGDNGSGWLHELADVVDEVFWVSGRNSAQVYYLSPAFERLWGVPRERVYAEPRAWLDAVHPDDVGRIRRATDIGTSAEYEQEFRIVDPNGQVRWIMERGAPVRDSEGGLLRFAGTLRDITRRKQAEEALKESQRKFETLVGNMPGAAWRCRDDADWTVEYMSAGAKEVFGHPPEAFLDGDVTLAGLIHADDIAFVRKAVEQSRTSDRPYNVNYRIWRADGSVGWVREQARFVGDDDRIEGVIVDLTELKRNELALQSNVRALRMLSRCNQALIHADSECELLETVCEVAVEDGGYALAWVGQVRHDRAQEISPVCASGETRHCPGEGRVCWSMEAVESGDPVARAVRQGRPVFVDDVSTLTDGPRSQYGRGSCICLPLLANGAPYGVFVLLRDVPTAPTEEERSLLRELASNLEFGLQVRRVQERESRLQRVLGGMSTAGSARSSGAFFEQLVLAMTEALDADVGAIARFVDGELWMSAPVAMAVDGDVVNGEVYPLHGTPCEAYITQRECVHTAGVVSSFPDDPMLRELEVEGYVGLRLESASGKPVGALFVLYRQPVDDAQVALSVLQLVATRAVAELERMDAEEHMRALAYHDPTTGLANRAACMAYLARCLDGASVGPSSELLLVSINLRRFKEVNNSLGHSAGDDLLAQVGTRLQSAAAPGEFVAHLGGDEFAVVASGGGRDAVPELLQRVRGVFRAPFHVGGMGIAMDATAGVAMAPDDGRTAMELVQHADIALHQARKEGADYWLYDHALFDDLNTQLQLARRLRDALRRDTLEMHYQPQVDLRTGTLIGVEALLRWHCPDQGWVPPSRFLPVAQQRQMMGAVFRWVLRGVARDVAAWRDAGHALPPEVSVNVAAEQLHDDSLVEQVDAVIQEYRLPPGIIAVEITETGIMRDPETAAALVDRLRARGSSIAIDDFGTGYSSLSYLKNLAADTLKIDLSFVLGMLNDRSDHAIVGTIIAMAHALEMNCIAEGVESEGHREALLEMGCERGQGYLFGYPQPAQAFSAHWLRRPL